MVGKKKGKARKKGNGEKKQENFRREALFRELKLSSLNTERYSCFWREMLRRGKMPDMWRKVETAWQTLEHAFDLKDYSISLLLDNLQEAEDERRQANSAHVEVIDRSMEVHETRLEIMNAIFYGNVETVLADKTVHLQNIDDYRNKKEIALRKINLLVNHRSENMSNTTRSNAISKINAFVEDGKNETRIITTQLQKKLENLCSDLRNVFSNYRKSTEDRRKEYEVVRKKDQMDQQIIIRQYLRITTLSEEIAKFRGKINSYKCESGIELQEIRLEASFFHNVYRETNERFVAGRKIDKRKAMAMSKEYNCSVKRLKQLKIKAKRILVYMQICRKYETQDEKILPTIENHAAQQMIMLTNNDDALSLTTATKDFQKSINFWRRFGLAQLIATELRIERDQLLIQTDQLRKLLKHRLVDEAYTISKDT